MTTGYRIELRSLEGHKPWLVVFYFADGRARIVSDHASKRAAQAALRSRA